MIINTQVPSIANKEHTCHAPECENITTHNMAHRFSVGISHYKAGKKSYAQIHESQQCCSHECAIAAIHDRIDKHNFIPHGVYNASIHNPVGEYTHELVRGNVEYHTNPRHVPLPSTCCISECAKPLTDEVYMPHVDHSSPVGQCYQAVLADQDNNRMSMEQYELGCCSLEHAVQAAHAIVDDILVPYYQKYVAAKLAAS